MLKGKNFLKSFLILIAINLAGCPAHGPPLIEECILGDAGCLCYDPRLPKEEQEYTLVYEDCKNYIATNPSDYDEMSQYVDNLSKENEELKDKCKL